MGYRRLSKQLVRQARPDLSERAVTSLARKKFEESARMFMEETLRLAVRGHPKGLWGFYGFPACFNKHRINTGRTNGQWTVNAIVCTCNHLVTFSFYRKVLVCHL